MLCCQTIQRKDKAGFNEYFYKEESVDDRPHS
jgi:hypothetical protein